MKKMKKIILTSFVFIISMGFPLASDCEKKNYAYFNKLTPIFNLTSNNLQLLKYFDKNGNIRFIIQNLDGTVVAKDLSRPELRINFPEIENEFKI